MLRDEPVPLYSCGMEKDAATELITKLAAAKRQLVTAVHLFFEDREPIAVHALAQAAWEIIGQLLEHEGKKTQQHEIALANGMNLKEVRKIANQTKNFFKHADKDPKETIEFSDYENDFVLIMSILDLAALTNDRLTPELQVFEVWFVATHPDRITSSLPPDYRDAVTSAFPNFDKKDRADKKRMGKERVQATLQNSEIIKDAKTDRSLVNRWTKV
jgi:hypothetical protein